jgi:hypothetical protein
MCAQMSVNSLQNNLLNPARLFMWEMIIPKPIGGDSETMMLRCQSTTKPGRSVGEILIPYKQTAGIKYPGKLVYTHTIDFTFIEGEDREVFKGLYDWCNAVISDINGISQGQLSVKTDIYLNLLNTDGTTAESIKLKGCYCQGIGDTPLSYNDEGAMIFTGTFSYDSWVKV